MLSIKNCSFLKNDNAEQPMSPWGKSLERVFTYKTPTGCAPHDP